MDEIGNASAEKDFSAPQDPIESAFANLKTTESFTEDEIKQKSMPLNNSVRSAFTRYSDTLGEKLPTYFLLLADSPETGSDVKVFFIPSTREIYTVSKQNEIARGSAHFLPRSDPSSYKTLEELKAAQDYETRRFKPIYPLNVSNPAWDSTKNEASLMERIDKAVDDQTREDPDLTAAKQEFIDARGKLKAEGIKLDEARDVDIRLKVIDLINAYRKTHKFPPVMIIQETDESSEFYQERLKLAQEDDASPLNVYLLANDLRLVSGDYDPGFSFLIKPSIANQVDLPAKSWRLKASSIAHVLERESEPRAMKNLRKINHEPMQD